MQHLYYADILLEEGEIRAEEIWGIFEKAPRFPQVVFLTSEKRITVYWEIIIACLLSHGICLVFLFSYFFLIAYIKNGQSFLKCVRSPINSKACLS